MEVVSWLNDYIGLITVLVGLASWAVYNFLRPKFDKEFGSKIESDKLQKSVKELTETVQTLINQNKILTGNLEARRKFIDERMENTEQKIEELKKDVQKHFEGHKAAIRKDIDKIEARVKAVEDRTLSLSAIEEKLSNLVKSVDILTGKIDQLYTPKAIKK